MLRSRRLIALVPAPSDRRTTERLTAAPTALLPKPVAITITPVVMNAGGLARQAAARHGAASCGTPVTK
jgi:hypothetical protein